MTFLTTAITSSTILSSDSNLVFIAGCFDGLHEAHLSILTRARALGDRLVVAINSDAHLARKGPGRPLDSLAVRTRKLYKTGLVAIVLHFEDSPLDLIMRYKPAVIAVGSDYTLETTVGYPECLAWGGRIEILPRTPGISTTEIVNQRRAQP